MNKMSKKQVIQLAAVLAVIAGIFFIAHEAKAPAETTTGSVNATNLPQIDPASIGKIIKDPSTGKEFMSNQLIVEFQPTVSEQDSLAIIAAVKGKMLQRFTQAPLFLVQVTDGGDGSNTRKAVTTLKANASVKSVDLNYLTTLPTSNKTLPK